MIDAARVRELEQEFRRRASSMRANAARMPADKRGGVKAEAQRFADAAAILGAVVRLNLIEVKP